jgi:hypothetical protein
VRSKKNNEERRKNNEERRKKKEERRKKKEERRKKKEVPLPNFQSRFKHARKSTCCTPYEFAAFSIDTWD